MSSSSSLYACVAQMALNNGRDLGNKRGIAVAQESIRQMSDKISAQRTSTHVNNDGNHDKIR
jgi:hypothetical protein